MAKCGECDNFGKCPHRKETDDAYSCSMFYPDVYMQTNHRDEWNKYIEKLENSESEEE